jgi:hypothetical protein
LVTAPDPQYLFGSELGTEGLAQTSRKKPDPHSPKNEPLPDQEDDSRSAVENEQLGENRKNWEDEHQQNDR